MPRPAFVMLAKAQARQELRRRGYSVADSFEVARHVTDEMVAEAVAEADAVQEVGAIGDGVILKRLIAFFQSDLGKLLVKILLTLLLGPAEQQPDPEEVPLIPGGSP